MFKRWMTGWLAIWLIASMSTVQAQSQSSSDSDPGVLQATTLPAPIPLSPVIANRFFPAFPGLTWTYGGNPREIALMIRMLETQDTAEGPVYLWDGFQGQRWVQNLTDGKVMEYRNNQWRVLFDLNAEADSTWTVEPFGEGDLLDNAEMAIVNREEKIEVAYGAYAPVIHISVRNPNLADAGVTDLWFASDIGLVKWSETSIAGPQAYELASFINRNEPVIVIDPPFPTPIIDLADLFPTRSGLIWEYSGSPLKTTRRISMVGVERSLPPLTYLWEGFMGAQRIRKTDDGQIMEIIGETERLLFDLAAEEGASWTINALEESGNLLDGSTVTVISRTEDLTVSYGGFKQTLHLGLKPNPQLADAGVVDMWFAPGVGLVKWTEITFAGPQTYELFELSGSGIFPTPEPGDSTVIIDPIPLPGPIRPIEDYENRTQTESGDIRYEIGTIQSSYNQGDVIEMVYRVTALNNEVTFQFNSTQQYDFRFLNENGEVVWVWSANKDFGDALTSFTLKAEESNTFFARMSLDSDIIPSGTYQLLGFMPTNAWQVETIPTESTQISLPFQIVGDPTRAGLSGSVTDAQGNPVAAVVSLTQSNTLEAEEDLVTTAVAAWAARGGEFYFRGIEPGTYTLTARADGYQIHAQQLDIAASLSRIEIVLKQREQSIYTNVHEMVKGAFIAKLGTNKQQYAFGDSVYVRYRLKNISANDLKLTFPSGQQYDFHLDGSQGRVWTWSQDKSFIQALSSQTLAAGETYEFETAFVLQDSWNKNTPSFLLSSHLAVSLDDGGQVTSDMTEAIVKFANSGWLPPAPGRPSPLSASLNITREQYTASDTVNINYHLTNTSEEPITLAFNSGQRYDLVLNGPQGAIWGWSWTRLFTAETGELLLAPGDSFAFEETIALSEIPNLADGVYILRVYMTSTDELAHDTEAKSRFWLGDTPPTPTPVPLPVDPTTGEGSTDLKRTGDFDANGQVDFADFLNFASAFGTTVGMADYKTDFDLDSDGQIGFSDFLTFASVFGK